MQADSDRQSNIVGSNGSLQLGLKYRSLSGDIEIHIWEDHLFSKQQLLGLQV